ncbi:MAG TPA: magnesium transporter [Chthoniobacteraceae bacterium]|nr:magnesium transporter [Chthoniobacteraceae bacterium]
MSAPIPAGAASPELTSTVQALIPTVLESAPSDVPKLLEDYPDHVVVTLLESLNPALSQDILGSFPTGRRQMIFAAAAPESRRQWTRNEAYEDNTIGRMMEPPLGLCKPETTIAAATADLRDLAKRAFITYLWVVDAQERLLGVVVMRDMLLSEDTSQRLEEIMIRNPFYLRPDMSLTEAMKETVIRHFPVYPVCDPEGRLVGLVRGQMLFEAQAVELSAQPGAMVGVEKEERLNTPWTRSLKFRHPWLQLNLVTAFVAAFVVGIFESTIDRIVVLAVFLPVLAGQSGNTGCQALAVALRGLTLGELKAGKAKVLVAKEALLGFCNGSLVGVSAGIGMYVYASMQKNPSALMLSFIVFLAMICSCVISGVSGATVPLVLKRLGADPATASSIFLTTATDVVSMGTFLGLATLLIR